MKKNKFRPKINPALLGTVVMMTKGVYGHDMCHPQSFMAAAILHELGYKTAKVVKGAAIIPYSVIDAKTNTGLRFPIIFAAGPAADHLIDMGYLFSGAEDCQIPVGWGHAWIECEGKIIDVNVEEIYSNEYTPYTLWTSEMIQEGDERRPLYCVADEIDSVFDTELKVEGKRLAKQGAALYNQLLDTEMGMYTEEGIVLIDSSGSWSYSVCVKTNNKIGIHPAFVIAERIMKK